MTPHEALNLLAQASRQYRGTAEEHELIVTAVRLLADVIAPKKPDVVEKAAQKFADPAPGPKPVATRRGRLRPA